MGPTLCMLRRLATISLLAVAWGLVVTAAAMATPALNWARISTATPPAPGATLNVKDYGAMGDGVTDDAQSIRDCVDACYKAGGGTVYIPAGTYKLVTGRDLPNTENAAMKVHVPLRSGVTVVGDGIGRTILVGQAPESGLSVMGATDDNVAARDLTSLIPLADKADTWKSGLKLCGVNGGTFNNIRFENVATASNAVGCANIVYNGCIGYNTRDGFTCDLQDDFPTNGRITYNNCESSRSDSCGFWVYHDKGNTRTRIRNVAYNRCYAHDNEQTGFFSKWSYHCTWTRCVSNNNGSWGFYLVHAKDYLVTRCAARGNTESRFRYISSTARRL